MAPIFSRRRTASRRWILIPILGFLIGLAAVFSYLSPRILSAAPAAGAQTGSYAPITVRFSSPIDPACAASHFSVEPAAAGALSMQGNVLTFVPKNPWPAGIIERVTLRAGACGRGRLPLISGISWSFLPSPYRVAYISADDPSRLMIVPSGGGAPTELLDAGETIQDFQISPRGDFLVYSTGSDDTPGKIWLDRLDASAPSLLADCAPDSCRAPAISPDGTLVAYERAAFATSAGGASLAPNPFIVLIDLGQNQSRTVTPAGSIESNPVWSPAGWLSYFDSSRQAIVVDDLQGGSTLVPNATGEDWVWLPDGSGLIFPEITPDVSSASAADTNLESLRIFSRLILVSVKTNARRTLGGETQIEDTSPAVSPDGAQVAFARDYFDSRWTPGKQLWVLNLKDSTFRQLTHDPDYGVSSICWSSDGARLLFIRFHETQPSDPPEIWTVNADGTGGRALAPSGYLPQWLP